MYVHKPNFYNGTWSVSICESVNPQSKLIERVTFSTCNSAWIGYRKILEDFDVKKTGIMITGDKIHETPKAILLKIDEKEVWIPKKSIQCIKNNLYIVSKWFAENRLK